MTTLYIVRHGEARGNVERNFHGWFDSDLTENGRQQIARLPEWFSEISLDAAYASDLKRTIETAEAVAKEKGLPVKTCSGLREIHGGQWEDVPWDALPIRFPESYGHWLHSPHLLQMPDGEAMTAFQDRIYTTVMEIAKKEEGKNVLIATHGTAIKVLLCRVRGIPLSEMPGEAWCDNASVTVLEVEGDTVRVAVDGDNSHLSDISTLAKQKWWRGGKDGVEIQRKLTYTDKVYLAPCKNYAKETAQEAFLPMLENIIRDNGFGMDFTGKKVVVKPNLLAKRVPGAGVTAQPVFVELAARYFIEKGAEVVIADSPGGLYHAKLLEKLYETTGMQSAAENSGAVLNFDTSHAECCGFPIIKPLIDADVVVSIGRLKTHMLCDMTAAVKNLFGSIPGAKKAEYHAKLPKKKDFCRMLTELCQTNAPQINIIDAVICMEGNGPASGKLKKVGALLGSANPFALDLLASHMMGYAPEEVLTVDIAREKGLCPENIEKLEIIGADVARYTHRFKRPRTNESAGLMRALPGAIAARLKKERKPVILEKKCIGCGECVRSCPAETMELVNKKAVIHREKCIKCYCCQELCPQKAVVVK